MYCGLGQIKKCGDIIDAVKGTVSTMPKRREWTDSIPRPVTRDLTPTDFVVFTSTGVRRVVELDKCLYELGLPDKVMFHLMASPRGGGAAGPSAARESTGVRRAASQR